MTPTLTDAPTLTEETYAAILKRYSLHLDSDGMDVVFYKGSGQFPSVKVAFDPDAHTPLWALFPSAPFTEAEICQAALRWRTTPVPCPEPHCHRGEKCIDGFASLCPVCLGEGEVTPSRLLEMERARERGGEE